ncbi:ATP-grasp domain-containing protein [Schlesneria paludicola]|uniref:ATP-grasp domain-containing protein n=1 Tax=Schlesneria paludicola TaxID=360056 RepID=UPI00029A7714|nr:RimK family alpha-L-glutamate ligase [Schlesneria paludicola]
MKLGVLASEGSWYYRDLERAAAGLGHTCQRLEFGRLVATLRSNTASVGQAGLAQLDRAYDETGASRNRIEETHFSIQDIAESYDVILVRTMPPGSLEQVVYRMDALSRIEATGIPVINSPKSLECAVDKFLTTARLQAAGLPVPETIVCEHEDDAQLAFTQLGEDVVVKPLFGAEGRGIVRVTDPDLAHRTFRTLMRLDSVLYLQRFIDHGGCDIRVLVLDGQVVGGMRRRSPHDFRTNVARDAIAESYEPNALEIDFALRAAAATGAFIAGIDLLYDQQGACYVIEVNAVPGWQAFGRVNRIDVAEALLKRLATGVCRTI